MSSYATPENCKQYLPVVRGVLRKAYGIGGSDEAAWITYKALQCFDPEKCDARHLQTYLCTKAKQIYIDHLRKVNGRRPEKRPKMFGIEDDGAFEGAAAAPETIQLEETLHDQTPRRVRGAIIVSVLLGTAEPAKVAKAMRCETKEAAALLREAKRPRDD